MNVRRVAPILALVLSLAAFLALAGLAGAQQQQMVTIQLGEQNNSGQSGMAELTDMGNGMTRVVITLSNPPAGVMQPVHIHAGTCASLDPRPLFPLQNLQNGRSESMVNASVATILGAPHAINAHKSPQEASVYVACGNITASGMGGQQPAAAPRTGGGGMASQSAQLPWVAALGAFALTVAGAAYALRRRQV